MTDEKLDRVIRHAERLVVEIEELRKAKASRGYYSTPVQSGAVRRASMDLTRSLADLRRSEP